MIGAAANVKSIALAAVFLWLQRAVDESITRGVSNFFHRWDDIQRLKQGEMVAPHFVDLHICYICNQHCSGCAYDGMLNKDAKYLERGKAFDAVNQFMDTGVRAFDFAGGGEPTVPPYMPALIQHIGARGGKVGLITNGTLLRGELLEAMLEHGTYIRCSVEASNASDYMTYKGVEQWHWDTVIKNLTDAVMHRNQSKSPLEISVKFAVGKTLRGRSHYWDGIMLGQRIGADQITFKALRHEPHELSFGDKIAEDYTLKKVLLDTGAPNVKFWIAPVQFSEVAQCWLNQLHTVMDWNGDVYICCYYYFRKDDHWLGNLFEIPFKDFWFSEGHKDKVKSISRHECAKVDCKFFAHHKNYNEAERGMLSFM